MPGKQMLTCGDCKKQFEYTEYEQKFFGERGWPAPKRCIPCRREAKANREKQDQQRG